VYILVKISPIYYRIARDTAVYQLQLDQLVIILNEFVPE
jgi:hypothetical protein